VCSALISFHLRLMFISVLLLILKPLGSQQSKLLSAYCWQSDEAEQSKCTVFGVGRNQSADSVL